MLSSLAISSQREENTCENTRQTHTIYHNLYKHYKHYNDNGSKMQEARSEKVHKDYDMNSSFTCSQNNAHSHVLFPFLTFSFFLLRFKWCMVEKGAVPGDHVATWCFLVVVVT